MTVCAIIGVCGSYLFGAIDQKFGVKRHYPLPDLVLHRLGHQLY